MQEPTLRYAGQVAVAGLFCLVAGWALMWHALPWAIALLPLAAPLVVFLSVALISILWATADVVRGRAHDAD
jgi:hypothetical protein